MTAITMPELRQALVQACERAGGQAAWSRQVGFSPAYVSELVNGSREPSEAVANALGFFRHITFTPVRSAPQ